MGRVDVLLGLQWGDEGKGKIVDVLTPRYDMVARFQGGPMPVTPWSLQGRSTYFARCLPVSSKGIKSTSLAMGSY